MLWFQIHSASLTDECFYLMRLLLVLLAACTLTATTVTMALYITPADPHGAIRQHTPSKSTGVSLWLNGAGRSWPDRRFPGTKTLILSQLSDGAFVLLISDIDLLLHFATPLFGCGSFSARLWPSSLRPRGVAGQADVNWDALTLLRRVCYYNSQFLP